VQSGYVRNRIYSLQSGNNWLGIYTNALLGSPLNATAEEPYGGGLDVSVADAQAIETYSDTDRWTGSVTMQFNPLPNFTHKATLGADVVSDQKTRNMPFGRYYTYIGTSGERNIGYRNARKFTGDYLGNLDYEDLLGISGSLAFGAQGYWDITSTSMATGQDFAGEGVTTVGGAARTYGDEGFVEEINIGFFAQNRLDLGDLFVTTAVRVDGNSAFGENYGFQVYPKADMAYNIPDGMLPGLVSSAKLRAAIGMAGKAPGAFAQFQTYVPNTVLDDQAGVSPSNPGNDKLEPENKLEYEIGGDFGLFGNRVGLDVTYWNATTQNALLGIAVPPSEGFSSSKLQNVGEILNQGLEVSMNTTVIDRGDLRWNVGVNYEWNHNEITDLGATAIDDSLPNYGACAETLTCTAADASSPESWTYYKRLGGNWVGLPIGELITRQIIGWDATSRSHIRSTYSTLQGDFAPDHMGSIFSDIALGQSLRLNVQFRGEWGASMGNSDRGYGVRQLAYDEYISQLAPDGSTTPASDSVLNYMRLVTPVDKRDNIRLQEVSLSYVIPASLSGALGLQRTTMTVAGYNLHWWDDCNCPDPNQVYNPGSFNNSPFLAIPQPRRFLLSFKTRF
jgi:hypothetical protein